MLAIDRELFDALSPDRQRRIEQQRHLLQFIISRLIGSDEDKAIAVTMITTNMRQAYVDGQEDCAHVLNMLEAQPGSNNQLKVAARAIRNLVALSKRDHEADQNATVERAD